MRTETITVARNSLLQIDTGVERRLLYLAAGGDLGCSLGLFWHVCDSFYLVDPEYGGSINYDGMINKLALGQADYMLGMRVAAEAVEEGFWEAKSALSGRRYHVFDVREPNVKKRLCFVSAGSTAWLKSTATRYNVVLNKDYAGISPGVDDDYPYHKVWALINRNGIYGETIGAARSNERYDFAKYRFLGFHPLIKVVSDTRAQVGFGQGLILFQKKNSSGEDDYRKQESSMQGLDKFLQDFLGIFPALCDFGPSCIEGEVLYAGLYDLMVNGGLSNWNALVSDRRFWDWLVTVLPEAYANTSQDLLRDICAALQMDSWGGWTSK